MVEVFLMTSTIVVYCFLLPLYIAGCLGWEDTWKVPVVALGSIALTITTLLYTIGSYPQPSDGSCHLQNPPLPSEEDALCTFTCNFDTRPEVTLPCAVGGVSFRVVGSQ